MAKRTKTSDATIKPMRVLILYRPMSEHAAKAEDFVNGYVKHYPKHPIEALNIDSREGSDLAQLYGIVSHPAVIIIGTDGSAIEVWQGEQLPDISEVNYYFRLA